MIRIFFPGQKVPEWLVKAKPAGAINFSGLALVYAKGGKYVVRDIIGFGHVLEIKNITGMCSIKFQSPPGGSGDVSVICKPVLTINTLVAMTVGMLAAVHYAY